MYSYAIRRVRKRCRTSEKYDRLYQQQLGFLSSFVIWDVPIRWWPPLSWLIMSSKRSRWLLAGATGSVTFNVRQRSCEDIRVLIFVVAVAEVMKWQGLSQRCVATVQVSSDHNSQDAVALTTAIIGFIRSEICRNVSQRKRIETRNCQLCTLFYYVNGSKSTARMTWNNNNNKCP